MRAGLEFLYSFATFSSGVGAWVGVGTGWEWSFSKVSSSDASVTATLSGWEIAQLQVGRGRLAHEDRADGLLRLRERGAVLPGGLSGGPDSGSIAIPDRAFHTWLEMGFKTTFDL